MKLNKCSRKINVLLKHREAPHFCWFAEEKKKEKKKDQKNRRIRCAETKKPNEMRVSGREEEAFFPAPGLP